MSGKEEEALRAERREALETLPPERIADDYCRLGIELAYLETAEHAIRSIPKSNHNASRLGLAQRMVGEVIEAVRHARNSGIEPENEPRSGLSTQERHCEECFDCIASLCHDCARALYSPQ